MNSVGCPPLYLHGKATCLEAQQPLVKAISCPYEPVGKIYFETKVYAFSIDIRANLTNVIWIHEICNMVVLP